MIQMNSVELVYPNGTYALKDITIQIDKGEFLFLIGPTGSGKSTFLKLINREIIATSGNVYVESQDLINLKAEKVPLLRRKVGVVFQDFRLLPKKTVYENIAYALEVIGTTKKDTEKKVNSILEIVGLSHKSGNFPNELSGGEQQRTSMARALVNHPDILLADEPTGNLDQDTAREIFKLLDYVNQQGTTLIIATHNKPIVDEMNKRVITLNEGSIASDTQKQS